MTRIIVAVHKTSGINYASAIATVNRIDKEESFQGLLARFKPIEFPGASG